jgi:SAM-dependent methyltransferase
MIQRYQSPSREIAGTVALGLLNQAPIQDFVRSFLQTRYGGLITEDTRSEIGFNSTSEFVSALIESLLSDPASTRRVFFGSPRLQTIHGSFRARNGRRKWLFEATAIAPLMRNLPSRAMILDLGAGDNTFLGALCGLANRLDLRYLGTDIAHQAGCAESPIPFVVQPSSYRTPLDDCAAHVVLLKAAAHHIEDLGRMLVEIQRILAPGGQLVLIEESCDTNPPAPRSRLGMLRDQALTRRFEQLAVDERVGAMKFLDWYGVRVYRGWMDMPLPLRIMPAADWIEVVSESGMVCHERINMGFAKPHYTSCLQRCNLVLAFQRQ